MTPFKPVLTSLKSFSLFLLVALLTTAPRTAAANIKTISTRTEKHDFARFIEMKKEVIIPGRPATEITYLTDTRFAYTVPSPAQIEAYAVIQWIRGCMFESEYKNGATEKHLSIDRLHFGHMVTFKHGNWQIDSDSTDPIYSSYDKYGRFALLRWNKNPASLNSETSTYYMKAKPPHGAVFVTDSPGPSFLESGSGQKDGRAQNSSLEFKTCLFHLTDVPPQTTPDGAGVDSTQAIWCVSWDQKFVWDFSLGKMTRPSQIDPVCLDAP